MRAKSFFYVCAGILLLALNCLTSTAAQYVENFNSYADGTLPPGWAFWRGYGSMAVSNGTFAHATDQFNNWCYYAYTPLAFGSGTYRLRVNVSSTAFNNMILWRWDQPSGNSMHLVFRTSIYLPPEGHTQLLIVRNGQYSLLEDSPNPFTGLHDVAISDEGDRVVVVIDGVELFDAVVPEVLPPGLFGVNPGDWGTGGYYDDLSITEEAPTSVTPQSMGQLKTRYRH